jgi:Secretion system C-terminal sorting domain/Lamin Tail Domain
MKKMITLMAILVCTYGISLAQVHDTIVKWSFPTNATNDSIADGGVGINLNKAIRIVGAGSPAGTEFFTNTGVSTYSASATSWKTGVDTKYWQVMFNTTGHDSIFYTSSQRSSGSGPRDFKVQYRIGKLGVWTDIPVDTIRIGGSGWTTISDTLPTACNNQDSVYLRWDERDTISAGGGAINSGSSNRIDNIKVWGRNISGVINPTVTHAILNSLTSATVVFSTPVKAPTATNIANYTGLGVTSAVLSTTKDTVSLSFPSLTFGNAYTLTVNHIHDTTSVLGDTMSVPQSFPFLYNASVDTLVITEINYHNPPYTTTTTSDSLQYIEVYNNSSSSSRVGGYKLTYGGGFGPATTLYTFPAGTIIAPNAYTVFAYDTTAVNKFYSISHTIYWTGTHLSITKAQLAIVNTVGGYIDSVTYHAALPWDTMSKGHGPSLVLCDPGTTIAFNCNPANWTVADEFIDSLVHIAVYGNPGSGCTTEGISNYSENNSVLNCYPNPTRNNLTVAPNGFANDITMFDILGNVVFETKNVSSSININTSRFSSGMYFVRVTYSDNKVSSRKISVN